MTTLGEAVLYATLDTSQFDSGIGKVQTDASNVLSQVQTDTANAIQQTSVAAAEGAKAASAAVTAAVSQAGDAAKQVAGTVTEVGNAASAASKFTADAASFAASAASKAADDSKKVLGEVANDAAAAGKLAIDNLAETAVGAAKAGHTSGGGFGGALIEEAGKAGTEAGEAAAHNMAAAAEADNEFVAGIQEQFQKVAAAVTNPMTLAAGSLVAFGLAVKSSIDEAKEFQQQMSAVESVAGATASQMKDLQNAAINMGASTTFSATDAGKAMEELAKAGLSVKDILGGAGQGTLDLAASAGLKDLGFAATVSANAMNTFKLAGSDIPHVADVIANAANGTALGVEDLNQAMAAAGSTVSQAGMSLEEFSATMGLMANNAIKGSDAGTSLKSMLMALQAPSTAAAATMKQMGISAYDSNGNMKSMKEIVKNLEVAFKGLSQEQKNQRAITIFGADGIRAFNVLTKEGSARLGELTGQMAKQGTAAEASKVRLDNLAGSQEALSGALSSLKIAFGLILIDTVRAFTNGVGNAVGILAQFAMSLLDITNKFRDWLKPVVDAIAANKTFQAILSSVSIAVGILAGGAGIVLLTRGFQLLAATIRAAVMPSITAMIATLTPILIPLGLVAAAVAALYFAYKTNFGGMKQIVDNAMKFITAALKTVPIWYRAVVAAGGILVKGVQANWSAVSDIFRGVAMVLHGAIVIPVIRTYNSVVQWFSEMAAQVRETVGNFIQGVTNGFANIRTGIANGLSAAGSVVSKFINGIGQLFQPLNGFLKSIGINIGDTLAGMLNTGISYFTGLINEGAAQAEAARAAAAEEHRKAEAEAAEARAKQDAANKAARAAAVKDYLANNPEVDQGLKLITGGVSKFNSTTTTAMAQLKDTWEDASIVSSRTFAKALSGTTVQAAVLHTTINKVGQAVNVATRTLPDVPKGVGKAAKATATQIDALVPKARQLAKALKDAYKSGDPEAIRAATRAINEFERANKGGAQAIAEANKELSAQDALTKRGIASSKAAESQKKKADAAAAAAAKKVAAAQKKAADELAAQAKKEQAAAEARAKAIQGVRDQLHKLNQQIIDGTKDGKVTQEQYDSWRRALDSLGTSAARNKIPLSQVAAEQLAHSRALLVNAANAVAATKAAAALHAQNLNTIKYLPKSTDARLAEVAAIAKAAHNTELLTAVTAEQTKRRVALEGQASDMIANAQKAVRDATEDNTTTLLKQAQAMDDFAVKVPKYADELHKAAESLRQLDALQKQTSTSTNVSNKSKSLLESGASYQTDAEAQISGTDKLSTGDRLILDIHAQIDAEKQLQTVLKQKIALNGPFTKQYADQLAASEANTESLQTEETAVAGVNKRLAEWTQHQKDLAKSSDLLEQANQQLADDLDDHKDAVVKLSEALRAQALIDTEGAAALLAKADALDALYKKRLTQKKAEDLAADSTKLLEDATNKLNEMNQDSSDSLDTLIRKLEMQAELDSANADSLRLQIRLLKEASDAAKERAAALKIGTDSAQLMENAENALNDVYGKNTDSLRKQAAALIAQASVDTVAKDSLLALAAALLTADDYTKTLTNSEKVRNSTATALQDAQTDILNIQAELNGETNKAVDAVDKHIATLEEQQGAEAANVLALQDLLEQQIDNREEVNAQIATGNANIQNLDDQIKKLKELQAAVKAKRDADKLAADTKKLLDDADSQTKTVTSANPWLKSTGILEEKNALLERATALRAQAVLDKDNAELLKQKAQLLEDINAELDKQKGYSQWGGVGKFASDFSAQLSDPVALGRGLNTLGNAVLNGMSGMKSIIDGFASGGPIGAIVALIAQSETFKDILEVLNPIIQALADAVGSLLEPLLPLIQVISMALMPVLKVFATIISSLILPVFQLLFPIIKFFGQVLLSVAKFVSYIWNAVATVINNLLGWLGVKIKLMDIDALSKAQQDLADLTWDSAMATAKNADAAKDAAKATKDLSESLSNVPTGFLTNLSRYRASDEVASRGGSGNVDNATPSIGSVTINGNNPMEIWNFIQDQLRRSGIRNNGSVVSTMGDFNR